MKIGIGTVQFGLNYGISNFSGKVSEKVARKILYTGFSSSIDTIDTANNYGESERVLGRLALKRAKIITKISISSKETSNLELSIKKKIKNSLDRLKLKSLYGVLIHNPKLLKKYHYEATNKIFKNFKETGIIKKFGISVYNPKDLNEIIKHLSIDIIQLPINLFDRRMEKSGWLKKLKYKGIEIHARSIFLQGLLLLPKDKIPKKFLRYKKIFKDWYNWLDVHHDVNSKEACISYIKSLSEIDKIIIGFNNVSEIKEIVKIYKSKKKKKFPDISSNRKLLLEPQYWKKL